MGIVNLTPDSFYAGSRAQGDAALERMHQFWEEGADVIDLGACSTRPGSVQPSLEEEWSRLEPVLKQILRFAQNDRRISIDTYRPEIVKKAYDIIGPFLVNDVGGGEAEMLQTVGQLSLPYVAMHGRPFQGDIVADVLDFFRTFSHKAQDAGIGEWLLDPGFGFGKTLEENYELLRRLDEVAAAFPQETFVGVSRKSMIYKALGIAPEEAMPATQVVQFEALRKGATWLRVHDVAAAVQTARLYSTIYTSSPGAAK